MQPIDRLLSLVRPGDTVTLELSATEAGVQAIIIPRLKGRPFDPDAKGEEQRLLAALAYPTLVKPEPGASLNDALANALDVMEGAQATALDALANLDAHAAALREAADAATKAAKAKAKAPGKKSPAVTVAESSDEDGDEDGETAEATTADSETPPVAPVPASAILAPAAAPAPAAPSLFD